MQTQNGITVTGVTKSFGTLRAVDNLDLLVPAGQVLALLGPNGAGKSTLTEMILALRNPDAGSIQVFGENPRNAVRAGKIGAMLQNGALLADVSVHSLLRTIYDISAHPLPLNRVIELADVGGILKTSTSKLSGGQAQRVRFAMAIMPNPDLIMLDEPTVGLDVDARRSFWSTMRQFAAAGRTIVYATHYLAEADEFSDRIVVLNHGRVIADGTGETIKNLVGGKQVSFHAAGGDFASLPGVIRVTQENGRTVLTTSDSDALLRSLVCGPHAHQISDIAVSAPSLEDAFVNLVAEGESK